MDVPFDDFPFSDYIIEGDVLPAQLEVLACICVSIEYDCRVPPASVHVQPTDPRNVVGLAAYVTTGVTFHASPEFLDALPLNQPVRLRHDFSSSHVLFDSFHPYPNGFVADTKELGNLPDGRPAGDDAMAP